MKPFQLKQVLTAKITKNRDNHHPVHPQPRSGHRIVSSDQYVYSFGGFNDKISLNDPNVGSTWPQTCPLFQELWRFCKTTRTWTLLECDTDCPLPKELVSHCATLLTENGQQKLIIFGGSSYPFGDRSSNRMYICDLKNLKWSLVYYNNFNDIDLENVDMILDYEFYNDNGNIPQPGYGQAIAIDSIGNNNIYICGGTNFNGTEYNLNVHRFEWSTKRWTRLADSSMTTLLDMTIKARYRHEMVYWCEKLYVIGGGICSSEMMAPDYRGDDGVERHHPFSTEVIPTFNLTSNCWSLTSTTSAITGDHSQAPAPRYGHGCCLFQSDVYVVGGTNEQIVFADVWRLHLPTMTWTEMVHCPLPKPLYFHSASITPAGEFTIFGGVHNISGTKKRSNILYSGWMTIPSLQVMARDKLLQLARYLAYWKNAKVSSLLDDKNDVPYLSIEMLEWFLNQHGISRTLFLN